MAKHTTTWRPDTCNCEVQYEWDDAEPQETRQHTVKAVTRKCAAHQEHGHDAQVFTRLLNENSRKNRVLTELAIQIPEAFDEIIENGVSVKRIKDGLECKWTFDDRRRLVVDLLGFKKQQKDRIISHMSEILPGDVEVR